MNNVVGNKAVCEKLCRDVLADKLSHALILEGPRGTGKHTIAKNLAAALACSKKDHSSVFPCCDCLSCKKVLGGLSPDLITVGCDGKATLGIESVRFLKEDVRTVPNDLDFKIYVIEDADKMTPQAQNAFLLTLEEPPTYVRFILLCENASLLLETIRSRAPILRTEPVANDELDAYLVSADRRAAQMKLSSPTDYAELIMASKNGIGMALDLLEPKNFNPIKEIRSLAVEFCDVAVSGAGARRALPMLQRFSQKRDGLSIQLTVLSDAVTDLVLLKKSENAQLSFFSDRERAFELCDKASISFLYDLSSAVLAAIDSVQMNANVRLTLIKLLSDSGII